MNKDIRSKGYMDLWVSNLVSNLMKLGLSLAAREAARLQTFEYVTHTSFLLVSYCSDGPDSMSG
jgi:hypothetical protein